MSGVKDNKIKQKVANEKHRNYSLPGDNPVCEMFNRFPMLNVAHLAKSMGINRTLMQQYINGRKRPSPKRAAEIEAYIHTIGFELTKIHL
jgi:hypothetical protein